MVSLPSSTHCRKPSINNCTSARALGQRYFFSGAADRPGPGEGLTYERESAARRRGGNEPQMNADGRRRRPEGLGTPPPSAGRACHQCLRPRVRDYRPGEVGLESRGFPWDIIDRRVQRGVVAGDGADRSPATRFFIGLVKGAQPR